MSGSCERVFVDARLSSPSLDDWSSCVFIIAKRAFGRTVAIFTERESAALIRAVAYCLILSNTTVRT